jgi:protein-S-isoprenylcysteine O-methyltransferase Ste14
VKPIYALLIRIILLVGTVAAWLWAYRLSLPLPADLALIFGGALLVFPIIWLGRRLIAGPLSSGTPSAEAPVSCARLAWVTTGVHYALMLLYGLAIVRAMASHAAWRIWQLPVPTPVGLFLVQVTSLAALLAVLNLALRGLGAPFAIHLTEKLARDWLYKYTRNPMGLASLACLLALGIYYQSLGFVLWALLIVTPTWLYFAVVYEERELELRFGQPYLDYKARTPLFLPGRLRKPA